ncbi:hypothetical protein D7D52_20755 [Nocardia yunnanensis]|uniref:Carrier domain-containing protein n=1 Tax=Nocardia yunnanensis TaxID=2382165 RepID=A0A386ZEP1_9NOCA|nr:condensation domain-containing protein [Nocardia yunnanensis]AYF75867.1 hypothetical protein D7D52_20755 [Nocardia yunnanensis]
MTALASEPAGRDASDNASRFPLSAAQSGIWNAQHLAPAVPLTVAQYVHLRGDFDADLLARAMRLCAEDLQSLRLRLVEVAGEPVQVIGPDTAFEVARHDFRDCDDPWTAATEWMRADVAVPIPLLGERLIETAVLRVGDRESFVELDELPLTVNGKLDRRALPEPAAYRAPGTAAEHAAAQAISEVLGIERVGLDDGFFALGGDSLSATRVAARLGSALGATVPVRSVFEAATVAEPAARAATLRPGAPSPRLTRRPRTSVVPLSPAQLRLWFINRFDHTAATYNIPFAVRMRGDESFRALTAKNSDAEHLSDRSAPLDWGFVVAALIVLGVAALFR